VRLAAMRAQLGFQQVRGGVRAKFDSPPRWLLLSQTSREGSVGHTPSSRAWDRLTVAGPPVAGLGEQQGRGRAFRGMLTAGRQEPAGHFDCFVKFEIL
jgi:hypothetical protein